jgi:sulfide:quinone oxidoreductase
VARSAVLILGGGVGGLVVANLLKDRLGKQVEVTLIDRKKVFQFPPSYPWVMLGDRDPEQVQRRLSVLKKKGIRVLEGEVSQIGLEGRSVQVDEAELRYDHLVIALGTSYAPDRIPGFARSAHHIYDLESAVRLRQTLTQFEGGDIAVGVSSLPFKCPAAPYEAALLIDQHFKNRPAKAGVRITFFSPEGLPLPSAGPEIGNETLELMRARGIDARFKTKLKEVQPGKAVFDDGSAIPFDLLIAVPPHVCPKVVQEAGLTDESGWIPVDTGTMRTAREDVYAIGDVASVPTPSGFVPYLPKAGVFAHGQAGVVANNISVEIGGRGKLKMFNGDGSCFLMTGGAQAAFVKGNWFSTPRPSIKFSAPSRTSYMQRVLFEKYWLRRWF